MKLLKKVLIGIIGVVAVVAITLTVFLAVRQSQAGEALVDKRSVAVIRVGIDDMLRDIVWNALGNLQDYGSPADSIVAQDTVSRISAWRAGVSVPAVSYWFATSSDTAVFYTLIEVKDSDRFKAFMVQSLGTSVEQLADDPAFWRIHSGDNRFQLLCGADRAVLSFGTKPASRQERLLYYMKADDAVLAAVHTLPQLNEVLPKTDITYISMIDSTALGLAFNKGTIRLAGQYETTQWKIDSKRQARKLDPANILSMRFNADLRPFLMRYADFFAKEGVSLDSISPYVGDYLELTWGKGEVEQVDTIITYDYDDNFDMVAKEAIQQSSVPDLQLTMRASPHLLSYLPEKMFYKFNRSASDGLIHLRTADKGDRVSVFEEVDDVFYLKYAQASEVSFLVSLFPTIDRILSAEMRVKPKQNTLFDINGSIELVDRDIHALYQLIH